MRRLSDISPGKRTGRGRRARDRWLSGDSVSSPALEQRSSEVENQLLFVADDLRESALALGGIEAFLFRVESLLGHSELTRDDVDQLLDGHDLGQRIAEMDDALASLLRSLARVAQQLR